MKTDEPTLEEVIDKMTSGPCPVCGGGWQLPDALTIDRLMVSETALRKLVCEERASTLRMEGSAAYDAAYQSLVNANIAHRQATQRLRDMIAALAKEHDGQGHQR